MKKFPIYLLVFFLGIIPFNISAQTPKDIFFHVYRNGAKIGYHKIKFENQRDNFGSEFIHANVEIKFEVKLLGFVVYDYFHKNTEIWKKTPKDKINFACNGCSYLNFLNKLNSNTNKNGTKMSCNIIPDRKRNGAFLLAKGSEQESSSHIYTLSSSYWDSHLVERKLNEEGLILDDSNLSIEKEVFNSQDCSLINFRIVKKGNELIYNKSLLANHYKLTGKESNGEFLDIDIWYDKSGNWVKMIFLKEGSQIEYFLDEYHER